MAKKFYYITTTLPYVNAEPHIGFALEIIQADVLARYHRLLGEEVVFNTGTDEHGVKIYHKALEQKKDPQKYCDEYAAKFGALKDVLNLSYTNFIRTTDPHHKKAAQEFWKLCVKNGDIYKKNYEVRYCVGCELEKTDSELVDGRCPVHPKLVLEQIKEENYFFRFSKYQKQLLALYKKNSTFVVPENRLLEIKNFVEAGLQDFSISRLKSKMPWGVAVPDDPDHVMYVWFDALIDYISTLGWPEDVKTFKKFWPVVQIAGKDQVRQQAAMWQAMLISAGLPTSKQIFIHGFVMSEGEKMSKSVGNVVDPYAIVKKYGTDATRYYLLGAVPSYDDGDFSIERFEEFYTAQLVNGVGNLTARIITMLEKYCDGKVPATLRQAQGKIKDNFGTQKIWKEYTTALQHFKFDLAVGQVNHLVHACDGYISEQKPWELAKKGKDVSDIFYQCVEALRHIALMLLPMIPGTAESMLRQLDITDIKDIEREQKWGGFKKGQKVKKNDILFPRLSH